MALDLESMANFDDVTVVEWMGRHVGWLTAAAALARRDPDDAPHLILLPETPADEADVLAAIAAVDRYTAQQAAALVEVTYEPLPPVTSAKASIAEGAPQVNPTHDNVLSRTAFKRGDVDDGRRRDGRHDDGDHRRAARSLRGRRGRG